MEKPKKHRIMAVLNVILLFSLLSVVNSDDVTVMLKLRDSIGNPTSLGWSGSNPCQWKSVKCSNNNRVTRIQIGNQNLKGTLPSDLNSLTELTQFEVMGNSFSGPLPTLSGLSSVQVLLLHHNNFSSFPSDFFQGMSSLTVISIDDNPFESWEIPDSIKNASSLKEFSANSANIIGKIPDFFNSEVFPNLEKLHLALNYLEGGLPLTFSGSSIRSLWLNGQKSSSQLNGTIGVLGNMSSLTEVWLHGNLFTGPLPDFTPLTGLQKLSLRDNQLTGIVPDSLVNLPSLSVVNLTNNLLQGPMPKFPSAVAVDMNPGSNRFCLDVPGAACDWRVNVLLSIEKDFGYPANLIGNSNSERNDPCASWNWVTCSRSGNITVINLQNKGLQGTISSNFSLLPTLEKLYLSNNNLTGTIPEQLTDLRSLTLLDVSNNQLYGRVPNFKQDVKVITTGNRDIGKNTSSLAPSGSPPGVAPGGGSASDKKSGTKKIVGSVIGAICGLAIIGLVVFLLRRKSKQFSKVQSPNTVVIHPRHSGDHDAVKITVAGPSTYTGSETQSDFAPSDMHVVEAGSTVVSIQVLRNVTNNFSEENVLGRGGFGTVYKGELHDGTKIAVKRMALGVGGENGLEEFKSEIAVLTKVRHRHLVALLGYCLDGNEKLLVYEYMPQGTLSRFLFDWKEEGLKPLDWTRRLTIALDVARGVEYLHGLAHQSFIHRDLKPSNILLGDDMRAKVADFGLVRLAPEGKASIATKLAGTFGYLAPEYATTGRVTTKVDVFSFGVILMEIITGRKALDNTQPEDSLHLVTWFRRMLIQKDMFRKAIDSTLELKEETLASISTVAELAGHCTVRDPYQRPDMGHAVNVLSSLVEFWKPAEQDSDDGYGIDLDMTLPQALKKWQNLDDSSSSLTSLLPSRDNTQTSIPTRPSGFGESFTSADAR